MAGPKFDHPGSELGDLVCVPNADVHREAGFGGPARPRRIRSGPPTWRPTSESERCINYLSGPDGLRAIPFRN